MRCFSTSTYQWLLLIITWQFTHLIEEQAVGPIRPDIVASINDETIFIEVAVTLFVDTDKLDSIKYLDIKTVEVDLREILSESMDIPSRPLAKVC